MAAVIYLAAAVVYTWPLAAHPVSRLASTQGAGDPYLNVWILGWDLRTLSASPAAVLTGRVFDANIFFPARQTLAYSDHLLLQAIAVWPVYALTGSVVACYNLVFFLSLVASALAMRAYVRAVTGSTRAALLAGWIWGFWPFHFAQLIHLQLQALYVMPLVFLALHRLVAARRRRDAVLLGVALAVQAGSSAYYGVIGTVGLAAGGAALLLAVGRWRIGVMARRLALAAVVGAVLVAPLAWPYLQVQRREGFLRNLYQASLNAARPASYLRVPPVNAIYGATGALRPSTGAETRPGTPTGPEQEQFVGFGVLVLAALGLCGGWRTSRTVVWPLSAVALSGFVLSLGPDGVRSIYATLHEHVFGFQAIRAPARFGVLVAFGLAGLAALGLLQVARWRWTWPVAMALVAIEYVNVPIPYVIAPALRSDAGAWLASAPAPGPVLYLPLGLDAANTPFMVASLQHGRPIVNGYSGQRPSFFTGLLDTLRDVPDAESLWTLKDLGVRYLVAPRPLTATSPSPLVERAVFGSTVVYELVWTPEVEAMLVRPEVPPPPPPGPIPFRVGEVATYDVAWQGSGMGLAAGQARFAVEGGGHPPVVESAYRFGLHVATAAWVSRFFEADDRLVAWTDAALVPRLHVQELREGRRVVDRAVLFDQAARVVRTATGPPSSGGQGVALPLSPGARDPVSAFYYARTQALDPSSRLSIPVNDLGRGLVVELVAGAVETITYGSRTADALRVDVRIAYRTERRTSPRAVIWMSRDGWRIPLLITIDTGFGSFRATLVDYRPGPPAAP